jgi:hypothetical protein
MSGSRYVRITVAVLLAAAAACGDDVTDYSTLNTFYSILNGASERPNPVTTTANGTGDFTTSASAIGFDVDYSGLSGNPTAAHIHLGTATGSGGVAVNLCGTATTPVCPAAVAGTISGAAGELTGTNTVESVANAMRGFGAYVNIHTTANAGGEIRGNIVGVY